MYINQEKTKEKKKHFDIHNDLRVGITIALFTIELMSSIYCLKKQLCHVSIECFNIHVRSSGNANFLLSFTKIIGFFFWTVV